MPQLHRRGSLMTYGLLAQPVLPPVQHPRPPPRGLRAPLSVKTLAAGVSLMSSKAFSTSALVTNQVKLTFWAFFVLADHFIFFKSQ